MFVYIHTYIHRPHGKESTEVRITQNMGKERENSYQKLKRLLYERHMQTHGNLIKLFRWSQPSFSIRREQISFLIEKDGRVCQNISILFPCVCSCACPP